MLGPDTGALCLAVPPERAGTGVGSEVPPWLVPKAAGQDRAAAGAHVSHPHFFAFLQFCSAPQTSQERDRSVTSVPATSRF